MAEKMPNFEPNRIPHDVPRDVEDFIRHNPRYFKEQAELMKERVGGYDARLADAYHNIIYKDPDILKLDPEIAKSKIEADPEWLTAENAVKKELEKPRDH